MSETVAHDPAALDLSWDDLHQGAMKLLPTGPVWPRDPDGVLSLIVRGLTGVHWQAWRRVGDLLNEADPRSCYETVRMWEIDCGLPDPCVDPPPSSIDGRRAAILARRREGGTTTPMDFHALADGLGYTIEITEFRPFRTYSTCNSFLNTESGGWPHAWMVNVVSADRAVRYMTANSGCTEFLRETQRGDLECIFERIKPAQTHIIWAYSGSAPPLPLPP
ncbi:MAG TPA: putative phage tail protein [Acetobacteraceae bacterium]|jgi:uncharacterized protein YmfQ (DUF2313 family)|nr:putative phage tail protein [Acetobacteraceae bacterium]